MKINEVIVEGIVSGIAGGLKGLAKGVAELPGKAVAGYQAGATAPVVPPSGWKPGEARPAMDAATQYVSDIGSAIRQGAAKDIGYKQATEIRKEIAPTGTTIGKWVKTAQGWANSETNVRANPTQTKTLENEWDKFAQKQARSTGQQPADQVGKPVDQKDQQTQQAKQTQQTQQTQQAKSVNVGAKTQAGTTLTKLEPLTLTFKRQQYVRGGAKGEWTLWNSEKPLPASSQAFLDSEEDELFPAQAEQPAHAQQQQTQQPAQDQQQTQEPEQPSQEVPGAPDFSTLSREELKHLLQALQGTK